MTTYITNINSGKLKDVLAKLKKEDTLIIFHSSAEKQVPIEMISLFAGAKKAVKPAVKAESVAKPTPVTATTQKKAAAPAKATDKDKAAEPAAPAKPASKGSKAKKAAEVKDSPEFDKAYDSFMNLLSSIKTGKYDPSECALGVLSAVRLMNEDASITFEAALPASTTAANSNNFLTNVSK